MSQNAPETALNGRQQQAIEALVFGASYGEAAEAAGVDRKTLWAWRQQPVFAAALRDALDDVHGTILRKLGSHSSDAVQTLADELGNPDASPSERISSAKSMIQLFDRFRHSHALAQELNDLRKRVEELSEAGR